jgi:hypothetical protein
MNLHRATFLALLGSGYTVVHKLAYGLLPALGTSLTGRGVMSILWLIATLTLMVFAYQFLKELSPRDKRLRYSLVSIIVFTGLVIVSKLPFQTMSEGGLAHWLLFGTSAFCNSFAILMFLISFGRLVARSSPLWVPVRGLAWGVGAVVALGLVSTGYFLVYLIMGRELEPLPFLQPLSILVFLFTYGMTIWFLIRFWRLDSYTEFTDR